jgi:putative transposase
MGRPPRDEQPGAYYHVTSRGNDRRRIQLDDVDCQRWERMAAKTASRYGWQVLAYCLMTNHFHLVIRIPLGGLSRGMCLLNGGYARQFNQRHDGSNHVFGRRFWSKRIETHRYLVGSLRYTAMNPVRSHLAETADDYPWGSHAALAGRREAPPFLDVDAVLDLFGPDPERARVAYLSLVRNGADPVPGTVTEL